MTDAGAAWADWPQLLQDVAECCGAGVALRLAAVFGGRELYVPAPEAIDEGHHLAVALGLASARKVAEALSSGKVMIPLGPASSAGRRAALRRRLRAEGKSNPAIARALGLHLRSVQIGNQRDRERGADRGNSDTGDLFGTEP